MYARVVVSAFESTNIAIIDATHSTLDTIATARTAFFFARHMTNAMSSGHTT